MPSLENLYYAFLAIIVPAFYLVCGVLYRSKPPHFLSSVGLKTKMTRRTQKSWEVGHAYAAKLLILYAAVLGILCIAWFAIPWGSWRSTAFWCYVGVEFASLLSLAPLINRHVRKKLKLNWVR